MFDIDIAGILHSATEAAGGALPLTITIWTPGTRNPAAPLDGTNPTSITHSGKGFRNDPDQRASGHGNTPGDNTQVEYAEVYVYRASLPAGVKPAPRSTITLAEPDGRTRTWTVTRVRTDPAAAMYVCDCSSRA